MSISPKLIALLVVLSALTVDGAEMGEYKVKALFLYNFAQFIQWPNETFKDASTPLVICVLEPNPFEDALERIVESKTIAGRTLQVRRISELTQASGCQILFISSAQPRRTRALLAQLQMTGLLIVGEVAGFANDGGVINFKLKDGNVRLEINMTAAERERLHISAKLLSLAEIVK
jgi:hypothetical protein